MAYKKKFLASDRTLEWGPWATVSFSSPGARDRFLLSVVAAVESGWGAEPALDDGRGASVRWRPGQFLRLNDMAYAHGGRIIVAPIAHHRL